MRIFEMILNILFPPKCSYCKNEGSFLCSNCIDRLKIKDLRLMKGCKTEKEFKYLDGVIYGVDYAKNPQIQSAVQQFKYKFTKDLKEIFGDILSDKLRQLSIAKNRRIVLIPVPLHKKRYYSRGFNQAYLIAKSVQERLNEKSEVLSILKRDVNTAQQAKLSKKERHQNLQNAFSLKPEFKLDTELQKKVFFVVDDVCTTGTTMESCAKVLKDAGINRVYGLVIARALKQCSDKKNSMSIRA